MYKVIFEVKEIKGKCPAQLKLGDKMTVESSNPPPNLPVAACMLSLKESDKVCLHALGAFLPYATALYRETLPDDWINQKVQLSCPDVENNVIFKVSRLKV